MRGNGRTFIPWRTTFLDVNVVRFSLERSAPALAALQGLRSEAATVLGTLKLLLRLDQDALRATLDEQWRELGLRGAVVLGENTRRGVDSQPERVAALDARPFRAEVEHTVDAVLALNVLSRERNGLLLPTFTPDFEGHRLARQLFTDDPRIVSFNRRCTEARTCER